MSEFTPTIDGADQYFTPANHNRAADWLGFDPATRQGALATAKRELEAYLDREMVTPGSGEMFDDVSSAERDDWACYEQAIEILDRQVRKTVTSKVKKIGAQQESENWGFRISPIALNFARAGRLKIARG